MKVKQAKLNCLFSGSLIDSFPLAKVSKLGLLVLFRNFISGVQYPQKLFINGQDLSGLNMAGLSDRLSLLFKLITPPCVIFILGDRGTQNSRDHPSS